MPDSVPQSVGSSPRKHHVVPAFYLAGFTKGGLKTDRLHVFDYNKGKRYVSTPSKACRRTDYYRVEEPGYDPNETECLLSKVEADLAPSVQVVGRGNQADRPAIAKTLEFAALCAARNARAREVLAPVLASGLARRLREGEVSHKQWEQLRASELRNGATPDEVPAYNEALAMLRDGEWYPRAPTVLTTGLVFDLAEGLYKALREKRWETHVTEAGRNGGFICSDNPLVWGDLERTLAGRQDYIIRPPVSLSDREVEVTFPVSSRVALVAYPTAREARLQTTDDVVAHINSRTLHMHGRLIFHGSDNFLTHRVGEVVEGVNYFEYVADARRRGIIDP